MERSRSPAPAEFDRSSTIEAPGGQLAHRDHVAQTALFERRVERARDGVWTVVGNGLSNQTFVEGPEGLIAIDTGESIEEMTWALEAVGEHTEAPVAAVLYTHHHYVGGTAAVPGAGAEIPVWGHERIVLNRRAAGLELSAAVARGLVHQFGMLLPPDGPDGLVNVGLGLEFRRAEHAPFTPGFVEPSHSFDEPVRTRLAGLEVELTPAPSDADDSVTIWFPEMATAVQNLVWPALFNIFAIRGGEYRDPRLLLSGYDHLLGLDAEHLIGAHGPPISGAAEIRETVTLARDAVQFLWDQTVRGVNRGLTDGELISSVRLPECFSDHYATRELYGLAEHHVRQIRAGLRGWFDGDTATLLPLPPAERAERFVRDMGGPEAVRPRARAALEADDVRWALELASLLVARHGEADADPADRALLVETLRAVARTTTSANVRNWCLTRALELEGRLDLSRFRVHRLSRQTVARTPPDEVVRGLRVLLVPERAAEVDDELRFRFSDGAVTGLRVRNHVAVPTDGSAADLELVVDLAAWPDLLGGHLTLDEGLGDGRIETRGDLSRIRVLMACFDVAWGAEHT